MADVTEKGPGGCESTCCRGRSVITSLSAYTLMKTTRQSKSVGVSIWMSKKVSIKLEHETRSGCWYSLCSMDTGSSVSRPGGPKWPLVVLTARVEEVKGEGLQALQLTIVSIKPLSARGCFT